MTDNEFKNLALQHEIRIENLAAKAIKAENYSEARHLLEPLLDSGSEYALTTLGWMHEAGKGVPQNRKEAALYYERAAKLGCLDAFNSLGRVLRNDGELTNARNAFKQGAELGNLGSMSWLGFMMFWGEGGAKDDQNGMKLLTEAAEKGHFVARGQLLMIERKKSKSIFRYIIYHFRKVLLVMSGVKEHNSDPYSGRFY